MADVVEYKCPNCNGSLEFDSASQNMKCPYCHAEFSMEALQAVENAAVRAPDNMDNWNTEVNGAWSEGEADGLNVYACQSCGGEIVVDETTGATACPYCGSPVVMTGKFSGELRPDLVIPFKLDKKAAKAALNRHLEGKKLLPKVFKAQNHIDEVKGVYVPFWMFDASVNGSVMYDGITIREWSDANYYYTETSHFNVFRAGQLAFHDIPVDASTKAADDLMDSLEPFDFSEAVDFKTAYLSGYLADKYDVGIDDSLPRVNVRVKSSTEEALKSTVTAPYTSLMTRDSSVQLQSGSAKYGLLPVWLLNTTWQGNRYTFAMNGQTGKFVGNLPMDNGLKWKYFGLSFLVSGVIGTAIGFLVNWLIR